MTFPEVLRVCAANRELVEQFDRLHGSTLSRLNGIERLIDEATGKLAADLAAFVDFVRDVVWERLPPDVRHTATLSWRT